MSRFRKFFKSVWMVAMSVTTLVLSFVPETFFTHGFIDVDYPIDCVVICNRLLFLIGILLVTSIVVGFYEKVRNSIAVVGVDYNINVEYGDILGTEKCKRIINFDECFTTDVGNTPEKINPKSLCGQYLCRHPNLNMDQLISNAKLNPEKSKSKFLEKNRYVSGSIVPNGDDLLLAFAKLDESGRGMFESSEDYVCCLFTMWNEIDKFYGQQDVCVPILGAGITRFGNRSYSKQELLDMMIWSYKISPHKIKKPYKIRIICQKDEDFSLNKINAV